MLFLKDALWGGGGVPTEAGLVDGGLDSRGRGQEGLAWQAKAEPSHGAGSVEEAGQGLGGVQGLRFRGG